MIIVTGGAGFIGSNLVKALNDKGQDKILVVDHLGHDEKFKNLIGLKFLDYQQKDEFLQDLLDDVYDDEPIEAVFHQGACSNTMEYDSGYMLETNYEYSKTLLHFCLRRNIPFYYASSASVYGGGEHGFSEKPQCEDALNVYAFSKLLFDRYLRSIWQHIDSQVVGLRYFNVFGPQENHKGKMASVAYHFFHQLRKDGSLRLFEGSDGYGNGEQRRDFIYVKDVAKVNLFFYEHRNLSGIYNCGTGCSNTFNAVANAVIKYFGKGHIEYIPFPETLKGRYQSFTQADTTSLFATGYDGGFVTLEEAVMEYCKVLDQTDGYLR